MLALVSTSKPIAFKSSRVVRYGTTRASASRAAP
jgi:hypothetical protein